MLQRPLVLGAMLAGALAFALPAFAQKVVHPDRVYGPGGTREIEVRTDPDGTQSTFITVRDKNGTIREYHERFEDPQKHNKVSETHHFWNADGHKVREGWIDYNADGEMIYWKEEGYDAKGSFNSGNIYQEMDGGKWRHLRWDNNLMKWVEDPGSGKPPKDPPNGPDDKPIEISSSVYLAGAVVFEDSFNRFATYGFDASYTRAVSPALGVMGDVQWTRGTSDIVTYTKLQWLGGVAFCERTSGDMFWGFHALAGFARVHSHSDVNPEIPSDTGTSFAIAAGLDFGKRVNDKMNVQGRIDYNPTFRSGDVRHNFRLGGGVRWRF